MRNPAFLSQFRKCMPASVRGFWRASGGNAAVEYAFALPIFITFILGIIEFGQGLHMYHSLTDGSRAAVRYLSRVPDPCLAAEQSAASGLLVTRSMTWSNPPLFAGWPVAAGDLGGDFQVQYVGCTAGAMDGETLTSDVTYQFAGVTGLLPMIGLNNGLAIRVFHQERYIGS